ncbi:hypothetical protein AUK22_01875 [bacterium CG2_30_54_10]|nr:MAG: hypothetical protein AUK22_01875 [bacterium CG2_30_54_10]
MAHRYLISGANGFIGRKLIEEAGCRGLRGTALILPGTSPVSVDGWETVAMPMVDGPELRQVLETSQVVINLAGNMLGASPERFRDGNVRTVEELLKAMSAISDPPRLVHASSVAAMGPALEGIPLDEGNPCKPVCLYGRTKLAGERLILNSSHSGRSLVVRFCSVYGPGDRCFLNLFKMAERGIFLRLATKEKRFQLMFVDDLVKILWRLADDALLSGVLNVGDSTEISDADLQNALSKSYGRRLFSVFFPPAMTRLLGRIYDFLEACTSQPNVMSSGKAREMSFPVWLQNFSKLNQVLPGLKWTPLFEGIEKTHLAI